MLGLQRLGMKSIDQITKDDIVGVLGRIERRGSKGAAERSLAYLSKFFGWCADQGHIDLPPTARIRIIRPNGSRDRVLADTELASVWLAFEAEGGIFGAPVQAAVVDRSAPRRSSWDAMDRDPRGKWNGGGLGDSWHTNQKPSQSSCSTFYGRLRRSECDPQNRATCILDDRHHACFWFRQGEGSNRQVELRKQTNGVSVDTPRFKEDHGDDHERAATGAPLCGRSCGQSCERRCKKGGSRCV